MVYHPAPTAAERRLQLQEAAHQIGVSDAFIDALVEDFYARVRKHPLLGPIFENQISDNWDAHLKTMKSFYSAKTKTWQEST